MKINSAIQLERSTPEITAEVAIESAKTTSISYRRNLFCVPASLVPTPLHRNRLIRSGPLQNSLSTRHRSRFIQSVIRAVSTIH